MDDTIKLEPHKRMIRGLRGNEGPRAQEGQQHRIRCNHGEYGSSAKMEDEGNAVSELEHTLGIPSVAQARVGTKDTLLLRSLIPMHCKECDTRKAAQETYFTISYDMLDVRAETSAQVLVKDAQRKTADAATRLSEQWESRGGWLLALQSKGAEAVGVGALHDEHVLLNVGTTVPAWVRGGGGAHGRLIDAGTWWRVGLDPARTRECDSVSVPVSVRIGLGDHSLLHRFLDLTPVELSNTASVKISGSSTLGKLVALAQWICEATICPHSKWLMEVAHVGALAKRREPSSRSGTTTSRSLNPLNRLIHRGGEKVATVGDSNNRESDKKDRVALGQRDLALVGTGGRLDIAKTSNKTEDQLEARDDDGVEIIVDEDEQLGSCGQLFVGLRDVEFKPFQI
ncbi:hypothetical protein D9619_008897 [Psilocybe cf. subviscida]|uniref:Uncharacterized protein n=1 Tax=Psilocybe cf. subviscida TaxID=2480587 RepID=A0A8H5BBW1_9AGAR|nr:hypothetical protein D9619_008897 [Psilocybe cf. subviscida]